MAYSTITDLTRWIDESELIRLSTDDPEATIQSADVVTVTGEAIQSADAEIDSYLLTRWPSLRSYDPVPDEINRLSAVIAVYNLYLRRRAVSEDWRRSYEDCKAKLEAAAQGEYTLGLDQEGNVAGSAEPAFRTDAEQDDRIYTDERLEKL
ncbi:MAG TPA: DUF1320 domain-containing protein [archaeon]|nr:DUF1320 domain-containing protein [archaeon]